MFGKKFTVGDMVSVVAVNEHMDFAVGRTGKVTNLDFDNEWIGVYFGNGPKYISGDSWNEFFEHQLQKVK